ncbi:hypothetical protein BDK51DRAFT_52143 [Blyttiomyces helicus]|uniref:Uncharacterized protein n=1 Tax=Blyttiomyces helicus TaxID=388810 RepID=A0A4P9WG30_9FUNG|nr:hypothetical protein BDK51DRAFT_52143 [Blyttiomyces helicus]|eukprot:RKO91749.1 hypothetical protein BDK51DRAFT_52143 [Blyttiomyces helicus]
MTIENDIGLVNDLMWSISLPFHRSRFSSYLWRGIDASRTLLMAHRIVSPQEHGSRTGHRIAAAPWFAILVLHLATTISTSREYPPVGATTLAPQARTTRLTGHGCPKPIRPINIVRPLPTDLERLPPPARLPLGTALRPHPRINRPLEPHVASIDTRVQKGDPPAHIVEGIADVSIQEGVVGRDAGYGGREDSVGGLELVGGRVVQVGFDVDADHLPLVRAEDLLDDVHAPAMSAQAQRPRPHTSQHAESGAGRSGQAGEMRRRVI